MCKNGGRNEVIPPVYMYRPSNHDRILFFFLTRFHILLCSPADLGFPSNCDEDKIKTRVPELGPVSLHFLFRERLGRLFFMSDDLPHNVGGAGSYYLSLCSCLFSAHQIRLDRQSHKSGCIRCRTGCGIASHCLQLSMSRLQPPQHSNEVKVAFPAEHVLLLTLNRPKQLNAMTPRMSEDLKTLLDWFEDEPSLWYVYLIPHCGLLDIVLFFRSRVVIVTGEGRIFCAGADLKAYVWSIPFMQ